MQVIHEQKLRESILKTLRYFHLFRFPLYTQELYKFTGRSISKSALKAELEELLAEKIIFRYNDLYMLEDNEMMAIDRAASSARAAELMKEAKRSAQVISWFPFVKAVCVSGSLSKGAANENADIDFFIITEAQRLWICRSLLHVFKKFTFLFNKQHSYCMNYFLDESHMCIEEQNTFTATELITLIPMYNYEGTYNRLMQFNEPWVRDFYSDYITVDRTVPAGTFMVKRFAELVLNILFPKQFNQFLMAFTDKWWRYKWQRKGYEMADYDLALKTKWYVSKNHPANHQKRVLHQLRVQFKPQP